MLLEPVRLVLTGFGNVGRSFLDILLSNGEILRDRYSLDPVVVGIADSSGSVFAPGGLDIPEILAHKRSGQGLARHPTHGRPDLDGLALVQVSDAHVLLEATPTNLSDGQPGLAIVRAALARGMHAVLASKGPLVIGFAELTALSDAARPGAPRLRFSGAVGGALPTINAGIRDLAGARITRFEGVLNSTTQVLLGMMSEGRSWESALEHARRTGITETDPTLDIDGWDAANKLVIVANAVLRRPTALADVRVTGIREVSRVDLLRARAVGGRVSLLAVAERIDDAGASRYALRVGPAFLRRSHPLAHLSLDEMGAVYHTDIYGRLTIASADQGPLGTAAAMLRDVIEVLAPGR